METKTDKEAEQTDRLRKITDEVLETLCFSLEEGKSDVLINYLNVMARFSKYSFRNLILIFCQMPEVPGTDTACSERIYSKYL